MMSQTTVPAGTLGEIRRKTAGLTAHAGTFLIAGTWILIALSHTATGAALSLAYALGLVILGGASLLAVGPQKATLGMALGAVVASAYAIAASVRPGVGAHLELASLFAAGAAWISLYVWADSGKNRPKIWASIIWSSLVFAVWAVAFGRTNLFESEAVSPHSTAALFGVLALTGASRLFLLLKSLQNRSLSRADMFDEAVVRGMPAFLLLGFALTGVIISGSNIGWIVLMAALLPLALFERNALSSNRATSEKAKSNRLIPYLIVATISTALIAGAVRLTFFAGDWSHTQLVYQEAMELWREEPFFGHGLGAYDGLIDQAVNDARSSLESADRHALPLKWLLQAGVVGSVVMLGLWAAMIWASCRAFSRKSGSKTFARLALATTFFLVVMGLLSPALDSHSVLWLYAGILGLACGANAPKRINLPSLPKSG